MTYQAGLSGKSVHVQILGAKNLLAADFGGSSDPYVAAIYSGRKIGYTRVRPKALNPKWDNETFIVPMDLYPAFNAASKQLNMVSFPLTLKVPTVISKYKKSNKHNFYSLI
jgi:Ca2+-dependent lipid-binding protein